jgi:hypothetical protein
MIFSRHSSKQFGELEGFARDRIKLAVADLLTELSDKVQSQRNELAEVLPDDKIGGTNTKAYTKELQPKAAAEIRYRRWLIIATEPKRLARGPDPGRYASFRQTRTSRSGTGDSNAENNPAEKDPLSLQAETAFPLARQDKNHQSGQVFAWSSERSQTNPQPVDHQVLVLRLRDEMIASAGLQLVEFVSQKDRLLQSDSAQPTQSKLLGDLDALLTNEAWLRDIAEGDQSSSESPMWLAHPISDCLHS